MIIPVIPRVLSGSIWSTLCNVSTTQCSAHEASSIVRQRKMAKYMVAIVYGCRKALVSTGHAVSLLQKWTLETIPHLLVTLVGVWLVPQICTE